MAKLVIAPDCGSGGRGFESLYSPGILSLSIGERILTIMGRRQAVRHRTLTPALEGSNPAGPGLSKPETYDVCWVSGRFTFCKRVMNGDM